MCIYSLYTYVNIYIYKYDFFFLEIIGSVSAKTDWTDTELTYRNILLFRVELIFACFAQGP